MPPGGALNPEQHIYDEFFLVIEGRGTTEVWREGGKKQVFEWQPGTLFMIPINANYRLVNATGSPALLLAANNAPPIVSTSSRATASSSTTTGTSASATT